MPRVSLKHKRVFWVLATLSVASLGIVVGWLNRPRTPGEVASGAIECLDRLDARCLYDLTNAEERAALNLNEEKLKRFLTRWYEPRMSGKATGEITLTGEPDETGEVVASRKFQLASGGPAVKSLMVYKTDEGLKIPFLIQQLWLAGAMYPARNAGADARGSAKIRLMSALARETGPQLNALGIPGIFGQGDVGLRTWGGLAKFYEQKAVAYETRKRVSGTASSR